MWALHQPVKPQAGRRTPHAGYSPACARATLVAVTHQGYHPPRCLLTKPPRPTRRHALNFPSARARADGEAGLAVSVRVGGRPATGGVA